MKTESMKNKLIISAKLHLLRCFTYDIIFFWTYNQKQAYLHKQCENMISQLKHGYKNYSNFYSNIKKFRQKLLKRLQMLFLETKKCTFSFSTYEHDLTKAKILK